MNEPLKVQVETLLPASGTAADLVNSGLFGIWADCTDLEDSLAFVRRLRKRGETRRHVKHLAPFPHLKTIQPYVR